MMQRPATVLAALTIAFVALFSTGAGAQTPLDATKVQAFVDGAVLEAMRSDHIAGVSIAIVGRSGTVVSKAYGLAAPAQEANSHTLFRVGSISKTAVWIAIMQLVEAAKLGLDDPINAHLPAALQVRDDGFSKPIRIRDLMAHSAGFEDSILQGFIIHDPTRLASMGEFIQHHQLRRVRAPGRVSAYSNYGAMLAAEIVETITGETWQDYAERHIFRPLGMTTATFRQPYTAALATLRNLPPPMPQSTFAEVSDSFQFHAGAFDPEPFEYVNGGGAPGALSMNADDMAIYMRALLDPTRLQRANVLSVGSFDAMREGLFGNAPGLGVWRHGFMDFSAYLDRPIFGHDGDLVYQHSTMQIYPEAGLAVFIAVNTPSGMDLLDTLPIQFYNQFVGPPGQAPPRIADGQLRAADVVGSYRSLRLPASRTERALLRLRGASRVTALPNGDLLLGGKRYYPIGAGEFHRTDGPGRIAFRRVDGTLRLLDSFSAGPADRVSYFESPEWLQLITVLAAFVAIWGTGSIAFKIARPDCPGQAAALALDGLCVAWFAALLAVAIAVAPILGDPSSLLFNYPGKLLPTALWVLFAVAFATPLVGVLVLGPLRVRSQPRWTWIKQMSALVSFATFGLTLLSWGLLGYSGW